MRPPRRRSVYARGFIISLSGGLLGNGARKLATVVACLLEQGGHINSAGGYLRDLTRRSEEEDFRLTNLGVDGCDERFRSQVSCLPVVDVRAAQKFTDSCCFNLRFRNGELPPAWIQENPGTAEKLKGQR